MLYGLIALVAGFLLDLCFGDPLGRFHPVCLIGKLIEISEKGLRRCFPKTQRGELAAGILMALFIPALCFFLAYLLLQALFHLSPWIGLLVHSFLNWQILALRSLKDESMKVYHALKNKSLEDARRAVSMIVGRDTRELDSQAVARAAVETVAENTSDGVIAPLLFIALGGAPLGLLYKAVNTMDSMVGYKNEKYLYFGRAAARLDDAVNFIPSRLSAVLMIAAAWLMKFNPRNALRIFLRDRYNHASPNSGQTEAVCAGALGLKLGGDAYYFGKLYKKPTLGDALRPIEPEDIGRANRLLYGTSVLCFSLLAGGQALYLIIRLLVPYN